MRTLSRWLLRLVERFYLLAHGWEKADLDTPDHYLPPGDYPFEQKVPVYHRRHAVNAQHAVYGDATKKRNAVDSGNRVSHSAGSRGTHHD